MILAVTHREDAHAAAVLGALARLGARAAVLDLADVPRRASLTIRHGAAPRGAVVEVPGAGPLACDAIAAVWWRRPRAYGLDPALSPAGAAFAFDQVHEALSGAWAALDARWMNEPWAEARACHKPAQLALAERAGLEVPPTLVTTDPAAARAFLEARPAGTVVHKPLRPTRASWRPTRFVTDADRRNVDALRLAPAILQEYVPGVDVRVTVAGGAQLAAEIDARGTASPQDFRPVYASAAVRPCALPEPVAAGVSALVRGLGLAFAAIDLRRTGDGRHVFLEANPSGQWLFVEERTGQPITRAVAAWLAGAGG